MIEKKLKTLTGVLSIKIPSDISEITIGQVMELQESPNLTDLQAIAILSGIPMTDVSNIRRFEDLHIFGEVVRKLSNQLLNLFNIREIPKKVSLDIEGRIKIVKVPQNLSVEPAGAFFAAREIISAEINEQLKKYGNIDGPTSFNPSLKACCLVLAHYFYCPVTGNLYDEIQVEEFAGTINKMRVTEALPIALHFFQFYPHLSKPKTGCLSRLRQRWKKRQESALLKSLNISTPLMPLLQAM